MTLFIKYKNLLNQYLKKASIDPEIKEFILDENFIDSNPEVYLYYPRLFSPCFDNLNDEHIDLLCIAGFLYYKSIIHADYLFDEHNPSKKDLLIYFELITTCQRESIKIITEIFGIRSTIWKCWDRRNSELKSAILQSANYNKILSIKEFQKLADYKSSFGKFTIDCLLHLDSSKADVCTDLMQSHSYFYCAFQIIDDIVDFRTDVKNGQYNYAVQQIKKVLDKDNSSCDLSESYLYKYFFVRCVHEELFTLAIDYLEKAERYVVSYDLEEWRIIINKKRRDATRLRFQINNQLKITKALLSNSKKLLCNEQYSIDKAVNLGSEFIELRQDENGCWEDYITQGGISDIWSTGFILYNISDPLLSVSSEVKDKAIDYLLKSKGPNLWAYSSTWIEDVDSSNFVLLALLNNGIGGDVETNYLASLQNQDGGFSTYYDPANLLKELNDPSIKNVSGWVQSHNCVTVVSLLLFLRLKNNIFTPTIEKAYNFLVARINNSSISPYWWTHQIYVLHFLVEVSENLPLPVEEIINQVEENQNINGSFSDPYGESIFYTSLLVSALCRPKYFKRYNRLIKRAARYILENQYADGSWPGSNSLQIPEPESLTPGIYTVASEVGVNVRSKEFNRLFTTSATIKALTRYKKMSYEFKNIDSEALRPSRVI